MAAALPFSSLPSTPHGHFVLNFHLAVASVIDHAARRSAPVGPEALLSRHPFLQNYRGELLHHCAPGGIGRLAPALSQQISRWTDSSRVHFPLRALHEAAGLRAIAIRALMIAGLVDEDARFGVVIGELQHGGAARPSIALIGALAAEADEAQTEDAWSICRPLVECGLVKPLDADAPRSEWQLRVHAGIWETIRGDTPRLGSACRWRDLEQLPHLDDVIVSARARDALRRVPELLRSGGADSVVISGRTAGDRLDAAAALARELRMHVLELPWPQADSALPFASFGTLATLANAVPVIVCDPIVGEVRELPTMPTYTGRVVVVTGPGGAVTGPLLRRSVAISVDPIARDERLRCWRTALGDAGADRADAFADRFQLQPSHIRAVAHSARATASLDGRSDVSLDDVRHASRAVSRAQLEPLATLVDSAAGWNRLVTSVLTLDKLGDLERRCKHREALPAHLGPAFAGVCTRGVRALFTGASGTGKTLAAAVLATELQRDLFRCNLATVVDKFVGETEKNLNRLLSRAEELDVVLLLDEGDGLLGSRTDVKSANDRYANLETNFLLQRLEAYEGILIVTTNTAGNIDRAFQRRMDVVVHFVVPGPDERWRLWHLHLPPVHHVEDEIVEQVAVRCALTGGQIRNAALAATLMALDRERPVGSHELVEAIRAEYRKSGAACPLPDSLTGLHEDANAVQDFLNMLPS